MRAAAFWHCRVGLFIPHLLLACMSAEDTDIVDPESKADLWARFADQGLFTDPIEQEGFLSITSTITEFTEGNDER